jgi:filamin
MNGENVNKDSTIEPFTNDNRDIENGSAFLSENYEHHANQLNVTKFNLDKITTNQHFTIKNKDDKWILIQMNTFTNWINEQLKYEDEKIIDLKLDLKNGVKLIKLVNVLQKDSKLIKRYFKKPLNQHQELENINLALNAITEDGIKLVNIGNFDIQNGNLKLILGLIWHLILRYQIGKTKIPPKKLLLAWIRSVLPQIQINNLTSDLNDGIVIAYV